MSNVLSFNICQTQDCKSLIFTETTGSHSVNNLGGWGSPNNETSEAETAVLTVLTPGGVTYSFDLFAESPAWPTTDDDQQFVIKAENLGGTAGASLADGLYVFTYTVTRTTSIAFSYSQVVQSMYFCTAKCCVNSMFANLDYECDCSKDDMFKALKAKSMLYSLELAASTGQTDKFTNLLGILTKLCNNTNCNNCN